MEDKTLLYFRNPYQFKNFIIELGVYNGWKIESGLMNDRGAAISNRGYSKRLKEIFAEKKLYHKNVSVAEIVSWLDTFVHVDRILGELISNQDDSVIQNIEVYIEYKIEMAKLARVDCMFKFGKKYCLLEFRTVNKFERMKSAYEKKRIELMIYKDLMENYIEHPAKIVVFPFIGLFEYDENRLVKEHYENNVKTAKYAAEYISKYILKK